MKKTKYVETEFVISIVCNLYQATLIAKVLSKVISRIGSYIAREEGIESRFESFGICLVDHSATFDPDPWNTVLKYDGDRLYKVTFNPEEVTYFDEDEWKEKMTSEEWTRLNNYVKED